MRPAWHVRRDKGERTESQAIGRATNEQRGWSSQHVAVCRESTKEVPKSVAGIRWLATPADRLLQRPSVSFA